jgi:hypothetical protein
MTADSSSKTLLPGNRVAEKSAIINKPKAVTNRFTI